MIIPSCASLHMLVGPQRYLAIGGRSITFLHNVTKTKTCDRSFALLLLIPNRINYPVPVRHRKCFSNFYGSDAFNDSPQPSRVQELKLQDGDVDYLPPEYKEGVDNDGKYKDGETEPKQDGNSMDQLVQLVRSMFVDYSRLVGASSAKHRVPQLEALLRNATSTHQQLLDYMEGR